jgi:hypothetical protein
MHSTGKNVPVVDKRSRAIRLLKMTSGIIAPVLKRAKEHSNAPRNSPPASALGFATPLMAQAPLALKMRGLSGDTSTAAACPIAPSKKPLPKQPCKPLRSCGVFLYDEGIKKTLVFLNFCPLFAYA